MKLEVGMYVRTNKGLIFKIEAVNDCDIDGTWYKSECANQVFRDILLSYEIGNYERIEKASFNIIDLIEAGDYVNGVIVTKSCLDNVEYLAPEIVANNYGIKSILTKEQFKEMEYRINE